MTEAKKTEEIDIDEESVVVDKDVEDRRRYISERGPFAINANPQLRPTPEPGRVDGQRATKDFDVAALAEKHGEEPVREKIGEMIESIAPGVSENVLFWQGGDNGMSLVHVWFGPNMPLFRHSHPKNGDCLYYVAAGEAIMGRRTLGPGSTFFIPNGMPYKYTAGPDGVEVLEFRAGGGDETEPGMRIDELSLDSVQGIIDKAKENQHLWKRPPGFSDTGHIKPHEA
ncbi:MAG: hypothetical protein CMP98_08975 [Gammaproteobacteria bacterium]|nr:hypothetical protein [Gammaproteobacteria bacterium]OUU09133.1 MAG: hypothetical protein CBB94_09200 [Gammaproteobacteria bacterium TMED34]|tara:strand:- start:720 stop:1400 length:681 start_codon:yes stop_codon:yes gene_type:complete